MTIGSGIDPKVDYAFKRFAASEGSEDITRELINGVMARARLRRVREIRILNPFRPKESPEGRVAILDVSARDDQDTDLLIEMQMLAHESFPERLMYYLAKHYSQMLGEGQQYSELRSVHLICFIDDRLFTTHDAFYSRYRLIDRELGTEFSSHWTIHVIELPKFHLSLSELRDDLDRWCYFLKHGAELNFSSVPTELSIPGINHALRILDMVSQTPLERAEYEARLMFQRDEAARIQTALSRGRAEGLHEGRAAQAQVMLIRFGTRFLGEPTDDQRAFVLSINDVDQLNRLTDQIFESGSWTELLAKTQSPSSLPE